jgi:hypothetical protein
MRKLVRSLRYTMLRHDCSDATHPAKRRVPVSSSQASSQHRKTGHDDTSHWAVLLVSITLQQHPSRKGVCRSIAAAMSNNRAVEPLSERYRFRPPQAVLFPLEFPLAGATALLTGRLWPTPQCAAGTGRMPDALIDLYAYSLTLHLSGATLASYTSLTLLLSGATVYDRLDLFAYPSLVGRYSCIVHLAYPSLVGRYSCIIHLAYPSLVGRYCVRPLRLVRLPFTCRALLLHHTPRLPFSCRALLCTTA